MIYLYVRMVNYMFIYIVVFIYNESQTCMSHINMYSKPIQGVGARCFAHATETAHASEAVGQMLCG